MELHEFLEARIADDEAVAEAFWSLQDWKELDGDESSQIIAYDVDDYKGKDPRTIANCYSGSGEFITRFDPARILAECAAKRGLVEMHVGAFAYYGDPDLHSNKCMGCGNEDEVDPVTANVEDCPTLRILAATYSSHNDFNPDWAV